MLVAWIFHFRILAAIVFIDRITWSLGLRCAIGLRRERPRCRARFTTSASKATNVGHDRGRADESPLVAALPRPPCPCHGSLVICSGECATIAPHRLPKFSERIVARQICPRNFDRNQFGVDCRSHLRVTLVSSAPSVGSVSNREEFEPQRTQRSQRRDRRN